MQHHRPRERATPCPHVPDRLGGLLRKACTQAHYVPLAASRVSEAASRDFGHPPRSYSGVADWIAFHEKAHASSLSQRDLLPPALDICKDADVLGPKRLKVSDEVAHLHVGAPLHP